MTDTPKNAADDFVGYFEQARARLERTGLPPLHPNDRADLRTEPAPTEKMQSLLEFPKRKLAARFAVFDVSVIDQRRLLGEIETRCMNEPGWVLVREEWSLTKNGTQLVTVKFACPVEAAEAIDAEIDKVYVTTT